MKYGYIVPKALFSFNEFLGYMTIFRLSKAKNVVFERKIKYSDDTNLYINICKPKEVSVEKLPVFVYIHGGGWISGRPEGRESIVSNIAAKGYFTVCIRYGLAPKYGHPFALQNIYDALAWLISNKDKYNIDLDNIFVGGESAGAHLSATVGAVSVNEDYKNKLYLNPISKDIKIKGLALICGIYDMDEAMHSGFPFFRTFLRAYYGKDLKHLKTDPNAIDMSPIHFVNADYPPSFIISAAHDPLKGGSKTFADRLDGLDVQNILHHEKSLFAVHAYPVAQFLPQSKLALCKMLEFIKNGIQ